MSPYGDALQPRQSYGQESNAVFEKINLLETILDHFPGGIAVYDSNLRLTTCNDTLKRMLDYPDRLFEFGMPSMEQIFRFNAMRGEYGPGEIEHQVAARMDLVRKREPHGYERKRPNGQILEVRGVPLETGGFLTIYIDVSLQRVKAKDQAAVVSKELDKLTGLALTKAMDRQIDTMLRSRQAGDVACLHCIDLDQFSDINKNYGTVTGDFVLREIAARLINVTRGTDFVARTGGDRFQILQSRVLRPHDVTRLASRLIEAIKVPVRCGDTDIKISASMGFATINDSSSLNPESIMARANESVMAVKRKQRLDFHPSIAAQ